MNKNNLYKTTFLLALILASGGIILWQVSYREKLQEAEAKENQLMQEEIARKELARKAELKKYLLGNFEPKDHPDFVLVPRENSVSGYDMYLRKETLSAFLEMAKAAQKDGVRLNLASTTRNFNYQKTIWNNKWLGRTWVGGKDLTLTTPASLERFNKILEYSSVPGASRHHWGTDIDINDANPGYFNRPEGMKVYEWLTNNASSFGFCQTYNEKSPSRPTGYNEEKWHWSYLPLSKDFTLEYGSLITNEDIKGFLGDENVPEKNLIKNYVLGINPDCL